MSALGFGADSEEGEIEVMPLCRVVEDLPVAQLAPPSERYASCTYASDGKGYVCEFLATVGCSTFLAQGRVRRVLRSYVGAHLIVFDLRL